MFSVDHLFAMKSQAYDKGWNDSWLGIERVNPFPYQGVEWHQYEWGYNEAEDSLDELASAPAFPYASLSVYDDWDQ